MTTRTFTLDNLLTEKSMEREKLRIQTDQATMEAGGAIARMALASRSMPMEILTKDSSKTVTDPDLASTHVSMAKSMREIMKMDT